MEVVAIEKRITIPQVSASKRFGRYTKEAERTARSLDIVNETKFIKKLKEMWALSTPVHFDKSWVKDYYDLTLTKIKEMGLDFSSTDVESFSIALADLQDDSYFSMKAGIFLSALVESGKDDDYKIYTTHLTKSVEGLGRRNRKNITIVGDVGTHLGSNMGGGTIIVDGNATGIVGYEMTNGEILIKGNGSNLVGYMMKNGKITIDGDAGDNVGWNMGGGEILVEGNVGINLGKYMSGGRITVEGNAGDFVGEGIEGGYVLVKGDADLAVGRGMTAGEITIEGNAKSIGTTFMKGGILRINGDYGRLYDIEGGKIYHKEELIVDK